MELVQKTFVAEIEKSADAAGPVRVVCSTASVDRDGDTISPDGWILTNYAKNPVVLWGHDRRSLPIGRAENVRVERTAAGSALKADVVFASHSRAKDVEALVRDGVVSAVSVGFAPLQYAPRKSEDGSEGIAFEKQELLEFSFVTVPANPDAIVEQRELRKSLYKSAAKSRVSPRDAASTEEKNQMADETTPAVEPVKTEPAPVNTEIAEMRKALADMREMLTTTVTTFGKNLQSAAANATAPVVAKYHNAKRIETPANAVLGGVVKAAFRAKRLGCSAIDAAEQMGQIDLAEKMAAEKERRKDYSEGTMSAGGALVPEETAAGIIEALKAKSVVLSAGARLVTMNSDTLRLPRQSGSGTAAYLGENQAPTPSSATFDQIVMQAKKLAALSVVSNEMLADASIDMQAFIQEDLISACALKMDLAALTGVGSDYEPRGLVSWIDSAHQTQQTGTTFANWTTDLNKLRSALETDNVALDNCAIFMSPRTKNGFWGLANAAGLNVFRDEMKSAGTLDGFRYFVTSQISTTGAASRVFFVHMPDFIVAMRKDFTIDIGDNYELSGNAKSAFANDQSVVRCIGRHDFALRHPESGAIIHTVTLA